MATTVADRLTPSERTESTSAGSSDPCGYSHRRPQGEGLGQELVPEAKVLLAGERRVDVDEKAGDDALRTAPGYLGRLSSVHCVFDAEQPG